MGYVVDALGSREKYPLITKPKRLERASTWRHVNPKNRPADTTTRHGLVIHLERTQRPDIESKPVKAKPSLISHLSAKNLRHAYEASTKRNQVFFSKEAPKTLSQEQARSTSCHDYMPPSTDTVRVPNIKIWLLNLQRPRYRKGKSSRVTENSESCRELFPAIYAEK